MTEYITSSLAQGTLKIRTLIAQATLQPYKITVNDWNAFKTSCTRITQHDMKFH